MKIVGALSKSRSESVVYFCECAEDEIEQEKLKGLLDNCKYKEHISNSEIKVIAVESIDEMTEDKRIVGLIFGEGETCKSVVLDAYTELNIYLKELV